MTPAPVRAWQNGRRIRQHIVMRRMGKFCYVPALLYTDAVLTPEDADRLKERVQASLLSPSMMVLGKGATFKLSNVCGS